LIIDAGWSSGIWKAPHRVDRFSVVALTSSIWSTPSLQTVQAANPLFDY